MLIRVSLGDAQFQRPRRHPRPLQDGAGPGAVHAGHGGARTGRSRADRAPRSGPAGAWSRSRAARTAGTPSTSTAPVAMAFEMPDDIEEPAAAGIFMPFHLAWLALYERARLQRVDTLLVHAAAGGAGSAALQLGVHTGARVLATAGSDEKRALCKELGADVVIDYRNEDFAAAVLDATDGRGVDVAFDTVGGDVTRNTFRCMAFNGRHVIAGFASGIEQEDEGIVPPSGAVRELRPRRRVPRVRRRPDRVQARHDVQLPRAPRRRARARRARRPRPRRAASGRSSAARCRSTGSPTGSTRWRAARRSAAPSYGSDPAPAQGRERGDASRAGVGGIAGRPMAASSMTRSRLRNDRTDTDTAPRRARGRLHKFCANPLPRRGVDRRGHGTARQGTARQPDSVPGAGSAASTCRTASFVGICHCCLPTESKRTTPARSITNSAGRCPRLRRGSRRRRRRRPGGRRRRRLHTARGAG